MFSVLRAEITRSRRRRAVWLIALIALGILTVYSWTNHSTVAESREILRRDKEFRLETGQPESADFIEAFTETIEKRRRQLSAGESHHYLLAFFGTATGLIIWAALASTLVGADFRWRYWKTLASHEPRRWRLVVAKIVTLWLFILIGLLVILGLSYPLNSLFAHLYDVRPFASVPQVPIVLNELGRAWLVNCAYSTLAAAIVFLTRSNLAGLGGGVGLALVDGLLSQKFSFLGYGSPAQQVVALFPPPDPFTSYNEVAGPVWFRAAESFGVIQVGGEITMTASPQIQVPDERAAVILAGWALLAVIVAILAMRSRDLPA